ncbi:MAG: hypothetical protein D6780_06185 [Candidatus Dadabacteria bacterium]|nr:MAG: hypothetical protein D6780_06185 [Candidatus Dadabacteria bacterium]
MPLFCFITVGLAILVVLLTSSLVPEKILRKLHIILFLLSVIGIVFIARVSYEAFTLPQKGIDRILFVIDTISLSSANWLPSRWVASAISGVIDGEPEVSSKALLLLFTAVVFIISLSFLAFLLLYDKALSRYVGEKKKKGLFKKGLKFNFMWKNRLFWSFALKDFTSIIRDGSQLVHLLILGGLFILYFANISIFVATSGGGDYSTRSILFISLTSMLASCAFLMIAFCNRFVLPTISLEGKSYWLIQSAPISKEEFLRIKFSVWILPVLLIGVISLGISAALVILNPFWIAVHILIALCLAYGTARLAVGFGAIFAYFNWQHRSELLNSLGNLLYVFSAIFLFLISGAIIYVIQTLSLVLLSGRVADLTRFSLIFTGLFFLLILVNTVPGWIVCRLGMKKLKEREVI